MSFQDPMKQLGRYIFNQGPGVLEITQDQDSLQRIKEIGAPVIGTVLILIFSNTWIPHGFVNYRAVKDGDTVTVGIFFDKKSLNTAIRKTKIKLVPKTPNEKE